MTRSINRRNVVILIAWVIGYALLMGFLSPPIMFNIFSSFMLGFIMATIFPPIRYDF